MGGRGSGSGKGSRTVKNLFRKNAADQTAKLYNQQSEELRKLRALERGKPIAVANARKNKSGVEVLTVQRDYDRRIREQKERLNRVTKELEESTQNKRKKK